MYDLVLVVLGAAMTAILLSAGIWFTAIEFWGASLLIGIAYMAGRFIERIEMKKKIERDTDYHEW